MKTEKTFIFIFLFALVLKFFNVPGASVLLIVTTPVLYLLYFPFGFYFFCDKILTQQNLVLSIMGGMFLSIAPMAILFKLLFWPGAGIQLMAAVIFLPVLLIIIILLSRGPRLDLKIYFKNYITRTVFWLIMSLVFYFTSNATLIKIQHRNDPELARLKIQSYANPDNEAYSDSLDEYLRIADSIEIARQWE